MRLFLSLVVFDMVFHSTASLSDYGKWSRELGMRKYPQPLPTYAEMEELAGQEGPGNPHPVLDQVMESADSVWEFFKPWPSAATSKKITTWEDGGKFALCWLTTRLGFVENLLGLQQHWAMFSPNVVEATSLVRSRLEYADGSCRLVRLSADPEDLTHYGHWFKEKVLEYETALHKRDEGEARLGYCNLLAHRYPLNARKSPLVKISLIKVRINYPPPDEKDKEGVLRAQNHLANWEKKAPFFVYDVKTRRGSYPK
jgi:hypothetical protein